MSCATTWMHLEIAVLYEVGEKDKYCVTSSIAELKMIEMNLLIKQTHRLNEFMVTAAPALAIPLLIRSGNAVRREKNFNSFFIITIF